MKHLIVLSVLCLFWLFSQAQVKVSALPSATTLTGSEYINVVQSGVSKKATAKQIANSADTVSFKTIGVNKADSNYQKPGSWTTRYGFRTEQRPDPQLKELIANGFSVKAAPVGVLIPVSGGVVTNGRCHTALYHVQDSTLFTGAKHFLSTQGSFTASAYNGICLYKWNAGNSSWDLVAQTANTGAIWSGSANVMTTTAFTSTYMAAPGWYMVGAYYNNSAQTTAPAMYTISGTNLAFNNYGTRKIGGYIASAGGTPLANIVESTLTQSTSPFLIFLY